MSALAFDTSVNPEPSQTKKGKRKPHGGRSNMRRKQREYQAHVRDMLSEGLVNDSLGSWVPSSHLKDSAVRDRAEKIAARLGGKRKK